MHGSKAIAFTTILMFSGLLAISATADASYAKQAGPPEYRPQVSANDEPRLIAYCSGMGGFPTYERQRIALERQQKLRKRGTAAEEAQRIDREISVKQTMEDQNVLWELDYYDGPIDGALGSDTKAAIARFRGDNNLGVGTTLNQKSRTLLYSGNVSSKSAYNAQNEAKENRAYQSALKDLNYYDGAIDGTISPETETAIARFKQVYGIESGDGELDGETSTALLEGQAEVKWIRDANGGGVAIIKITPFDDGFRIRTGDSEYFYGAGEGSKVEALIQETLSNEGVGKVYVDRSGLSEANGLPNLDAALGNLPASSVGVIEQPGSLKTLFSREVEVLGASAPDQLPSGIYRSIIELHSPVWIESEVRILGNSEELTNKFTDELREIYAVESENRPTLENTLGRVRDYLTRTGDIKNDDDIEVQLKEPSQSLEVL